MPTETVYGLAASIHRPDAIKNIFRIKGRPQDNPLIVHIADWSMLPPLVSSYPPLAKELARRYWPGPLTMILPKSPAVSDEITANRADVGIRCPKHPVARELIACAGAPLAAPSANLSGRPSPTCALHVLDDFDGKIPMILDGGASQVGLESTVVRVYDDHLQVFRPGGVTSEMLREVCADVVLDPGICQETAPQGAVPSPGMKYRHYAPKAEVILLVAKKEPFIRYIREHQGDGVYAMVFDGEKQYLSGNVIAYGADAKKQAHEIFAALRKLDDLGAKRVYIHAPSKQGLGLAVYNRLIRAAGFRVVTL